MKWNEVSGVMCHRKMPAAEMWMLRWERGRKTSLAHIRNEDIGKEAYIKPVETVLENKRLKWFGHCLKREQNLICAKSLRLEVSGRRSRGRQKDKIKEDKNKYQLTEDMVPDRKYWMTRIMAGPAQGDGQERLLLSTISHCQARDGQREFVKALRTSCSLPL